MTRTSVVNDCDINSLTLSSTLIVGDSHDLTPVSKALAIQRQYPVYRTDEAVLRNELFYQPLLEATIYEPVQTTFINEKSDIEVNHLKIIGVSDASIVEIGSTGHVYCESRAKHIRHFENLL